MKKRRAASIAIVAVLAVGTMFSQHAQEAPATLTFEAKTGAVTFEHAKHVETVGGEWECTTGEAGS